MTEAKKPTISSVQADYRKECDEAAKAHKARIEKASARMTRELEKIRKATATRIGAKAKKKGAP